MEVIHTDIEGLLILRNKKIFKDFRGFFSESYNKKLFFETTGLDLDFIQDNHSLSKRGVIRGIHFQKEFPQTKLCRVVKGKAYDVAVDLRKGSPTFGKHYGVFLEENDGLQFLVPQGFGHGFIALSDDTHFVYKVDNYQHAPSETCMNPLDKDLNINWPLDNSEIILSEKDKIAPGFSEISKKILEL